MDLNLVCLKQNISYSSKNTFTVKILYAVLSRTAGIISDGRSDIIMRVQLIATLLKYNLQLTMYLSG